MFEFFDTLAPENAEQISETRADKIKASVLSRIKEERPMKKHFRIKPFVIAAAVSLTAASVITISAMGAKINADVVTNVNGEEISEGSYQYDQHEGEIILLPEELRVEEYDHEIVEHISFVMPREIYINENGGHIPDDYDTTLTYIHFKKFNDCPMDEICSCGEWHLMSGGYKGVPTGNRPEKIPGLHFSLSIHPAENPGEPSYTVKINYDKAYVRNYWEQHDNND